MSFGLNEILPCMRPQMHELFAHPHVDLHEPRAVVFAGAFGLAQVIAHCHTRQRRIEPVAVAPGSLVRAALDLAINAVLLSRVGAGGKHLGLVEEQVALVRIPCLALRSEQPALEQLQALVIEVTLGGHHAQFGAEVRALLRQRVSLIDDFVPFENGSDAPGKERVILFGGERNEAGHCSTRPPVWPAFYPILR